MSEVTPQPPGSGSRPEPASSPASGAKIEPKPPATGVGDPQGAPQPERKVEPKVEPKAASKAEPKSGAIDEPKADPKGPSKMEPKSVEPKGASKVEPKGAVAGAPKGAPGSSSPPKPPPPVAPKPAGRGAFWLALLALVVAVAGPLLLWQWSQRSIQELARRVQDSDARSTGATQQAGQAIDQVRELRSRTEGAEAKLAEAAGQQAQLEKLYRSVALDSADALLAELESALSLAAQQLASGGGAEGALLALQSADGRLGRLDDPALVGVRRAIARDIERLRSATAGDIGMLAARLDNLARAVDDWPLAADTLATAAPAGDIAAADSVAASDVVAGDAEPDSTGPNADTGDANEGGEPASIVERMRKLVRIDRMVEELSSLFRVRRVDAPDAALIAPDQAYFLRENLRLRLLNARLALLSRNDPLFRSDVDQSVKWIERYFDRGSPEVERALVQLEQLARARTAGEAPSVTDSLGAVRAARAAREARQ